MFRFSLLTAAFVFTGVSAWAATGPIAPPDSIGVEYRGNKLLIKHRVTPGETLYGVARRYKVPVEDIVEANSGQKGALVTGQVILVPRNRVVLTQPAAPKATAAAPAATRALATDARGNKVYKVEPGVTLFAIARRFQTTPAELSRLNGFPANYNVRVGESVIVAGTAAAAPAARPSTPVAATRPAPTARPERDEEAERDAREAREKEARERAARERARDSASSPAITPATPATTAPAAEREKAPTRASEIVRRVSESGLATAIQTDASDKYLALHKTAPVGTIMEVKNIMNGQSVYVRVIGQLPDTGENTNILVRLSKRAVQRLATPDQRFRVETNYVP
ncbi:LysM peptidoglycan-binding domain-containing protein [Hymenobacter rigui]|uniref:LysM peptidoglycan-binding domain-containing protein n=1 Tax=Hymenobacter rigui TaxID=334424 RepID=A0A3R9MYL7_9BACT|nr:LysM peptidoglycan-binding domain-containing protein [Hymenobacter rigui]RSK43910.1 LysM peptidoglycan-binding domain-containing protein [Hymenobacter rigui]